MSQEIMSSLHAEQNISLKVSTKATRFNKIMSIEEADIVPLLSLAGPNAI
jgi:hypothetical protein